MAEAETLTFRFVEEGLDSLRKGLGQVQQDLEDTGKQARETGDAYTASMIKMEEFTAKVHDTLSKTQEKLSSLNGTDAKVTLTQAAGSGGGESGGDGGSTFFQGVQAAALTGNLIATVADLKEKADAVADIKDGVEVLSGTVEGLESGFRRAMDVDKASEFAQHIKEAEVIADSLRDSLEDVSIEMDDVREGGLPLRSGRRLRDLDEENLPDFDTPIETEVLDDDFDWDGLVNFDPESIGESIGNAAGDIRSTGDAIQELGDRIKAALDYFDQFSDTLEPVKQKIDDFTSELTDSEGSFIGFGSAASKAARKLGPVGTAAGIAGGAIAALTAGLVAGTAAAVRFSKEMGQMAQQLKVAEAQSGATAESIQEVFLGVKAFDSQADIDSVRDGFKEFSLRLQEAKEGTGEAREAFNRLGISLRSIEGMNPGKALTDKILPAMREMEDAQVTLTAEQLFGGEGGERFIRFLQLSSGEAARLNAQLQELQIPAATIDKLDDMRSKWTLLGQRVDKLKSLFASAFAPVIEGVVLPALNLLTKAAVAATKKIGRFFQKVKLGVEILKRSGVPIGNMIRLFEAANSFELPDTETGGFGGAAASGSGRGQDLGLKRVLETFRDNKAALQDDLDRGIIDSSKYTQKLEKLRRQVFEQVRDIDIKNPDVDLQPVVDMLFERWQEVKGQLNLEASPSIEIRPGEVHAQNATIEQQMPDLDAELTLFSQIRAEIRKINNLPFIPDAEKSKQKVRAVTQRIRELQDAGALMSEEALTGFLEDLGLSEEMINRIINKMKQAGDEAKTAGQKIKTGIRGALEQAANQTFQALGQSVAQGLFGGDGGPGIARQKLSLFNAKGQLRRLREQLRRGEISYKKFQLKVQAAQKLIQKRQKALNESMEGGFISALENMGDAIKRIGKQIVSQIIAMIAKMAILKAIATAFNIGSGGFGGSVISGLGGGMFLNSGPRAPTSGVSQPRLKIGITGQLKMRGDDMAAQLDATKRRQRRKGRLNHG